MELAVTTNVMGTKLIEVIGEALKKATLLDNVIVTV